MYFFPDHSNVTLTIPNVKLCIHGFDVREVFDVTCVTPCPVHVFTTSLIHLMHVFLGIYPCLKLFDIEHLNNNNNNNNKSFFYSAYITKAQCALHDKKIN
jgi:hypothetical protein